MNLIDLIILLFLAAGAWQGYRRGLIITAGGLIGLGAGIWLAGRYYLTLAGWLSKIGLERVLQAVLIPLCAGVPAGSPGVLPVFGPSSGRPGFPPSLWEPVLGLQSGLGGVARAHLLAALVTKLLAFFLILAGVACLVSMAAGLLTGVAHLFLLGGLNRLGGAGLGLLERVLAVTVAVGMLSPVVLGFALNLPGGPATAFLKAWRASVLVPHFLKGWQLAAPALKQLFQIV